MILYVDKLYHSLVYDIMCTIMISYVRHIHDFRVFILYHMYMISYVTTMIS